MMPDILSLLLECVKKYLLELQFLFLHVQHEASSTTYSKHIMCKYYFCLTPSSRLKKKLFSIDMPCHGFGERR